MNLPEPGVGEVVVGVVITVPPPWADAVRGARLAAGDPEASSIPPHVTLLAPATVAGDRLDLVDRHLERVASQRAPFAVRLRGTATFRPVSPVVFAQVAEGISDCEQLAAAVRTGPLDVPSRFPYHPHVTIAHGVDDAALDQAFAAMAGFEARFRVAAFERYERTADGSWLLRRGYPLGRPAADAGRRPGS